MFEEIDYILEAQNADRFASLYASNCEFSICLFMLNTSVNREFDL